MSIYEESKELIPGGVNSPVRAMGDLGIEPPFVKEAKGANFVTEEGVEYLDFCMSWGALLFGHAPEFIKRVVKKQVDLGTSYGIPTKQELTFAQKITSLIPSIEKVRLVNSGTEATMSALRLARGFTGRKLIVKFDGCYHGHSDSLLVSAGSGVANLAGSFSAGVPDEIVSQTISIPYNDLTAIKSLFEKRGSEIAAVIVEPVAGNMGLVVPALEWLQELRYLTKKSDSLLIFDEVISGFRVSSGGAQKLFNITPDLTCIGKIAGGGFPLAAFGGKKEIMDRLAPLGDVYQAGTLSGNPIAVAAGVAVLDQIIDNSEMYNEMGSLVSEFAIEFNKKYSTKRVVSLGSAFTIFHSNNRVVNFEDAQKQDSSKFKEFWLKAYKSGIYLPPSMFETSFISTQHSQSDLEKLLSI
jgi:glutamate-1-semialdehyde 2,1-aminomutase